MVHRWLVGSSHAAYERAEAALTTAKQRDAEAINKQRFHRPAQRFCTPEAAQEALAGLGKRWQYHQVVSSHLPAHTRDAGQGRPTARPPLKATGWHLQAQVLADDEAMERDKQGKACYGLGTNIDAREVSDTEVIAAYKGQAQVEGGFRFLQAPLLFVSSLFVKKPNRLEGVRMVLTLALLVYSVAQRRLRKP